MNTYHCKNIINKLRTKVDRTLFPRLIRRLKLKSSYKNRLTKLPYPPEYLQIDIIGYCNLKCRMCPQGIKGGVLEKGVMDFSLYKKVIDSGKQAGVFSVLLVLTGEPLMHKNLIEMIRYAKSKGLKTNLSTNCTLLNPSISEALIKSGLDEILLSFDTVKKDLYEDYRRGAKFNEVLKNILSFLEMRKKMKSHTPFPVMHNLQKFNPQKPIPAIEKDFREIFGKYNIWIMPKYFSNWSGTMDNEKELYWESGISSDSQYQICPTIYQRIVVSWDGKVLSCCNDFKRQQIMGDLQHQSILEVWNGELFTNLREKLANKLYEDFPLCRTCGAVWK